MRMVLIMLVAAGILIVSCSQKKSVKEVAGYVSDPDNGLTKRFVLGNKTIIGQYIPSEDGHSDDPLHFRIWIKNDKEESTDSLLYQFNYLSSNMFRLVTGKDTLEPLLSERIANGRNDLHEFTLLFPSSRKEKSMGSELDLIVLRNALFPQPTIFKYLYKDITKASKKLYGYDQVKN